MFLIWGWRTYVQQIAMLTLVCRSCGNPSAHGLHKRTTKFTLFFIPLFPLSRKYLVQCTFCGSSYDISRDDADRLQAQQAAPQSAPPYPGQQSAPPYAGPPQGAPQSAPPATYGQHQLPGPPR